MTSLEQSFRDYYAAMTDADILKLVANKTSYVEVAQRMMAAELDRRHLSPPPVPSIAAPGFHWSLHGTLAKLTKRHRSP